MARRIALVSSSYHPYHGGVETHVREVARELVGLGHAVEVWTVDRGQRLGTTALDGITVRHLPTPLPARNVRSVVGFLLRGPRAWRSWRRAARAFAPDVLHVQCFGPNGLYAAGLARVAGLPLVVSSHGETFADDHGAFDQSALLRAGLRRALSSARAVTGCSSLVTDDLSSRFGARDPEVVPNGVAPDPPVAVGDSRPNLPDLPGLPPGPVVLGIGRLEHNKGFDLLMEGFARVAPTPQGRPVLVLGGEGSERAALERLAARLEVADRVRLLGALEPSEVAAWLDRAEVVVVPSRVEAFGIVVLEAWRAGTPVVGTSLGGPAGLVTDGDDGLLVDPRDPAALAAAMDRVLGDNGLAGRLAAAGSRTVRGYSWRATAQAYERLYDRLPAGR